MREAALHVFAAATTLHRVNRRLLIVTFLESLATIAVERGIYFFAKSELNFGDIANLWMALVFGLSYASGATLSHRACRRWGERTIVLALILGQMAVHVGLAIHVSAAAIFAGMVLIGFLNGMKWPVLESYVVAGHAPKETASVVGRFNISWSLAVPLALAGAGPVIEFYPPALFLAPAAINLAAFLMLLKLPAMPAHLPPDHPQRLDAPTLERYRRLLVSSRFLMLQSYATMWILAAVLPRIMADLGFDVGLGAGLSGLLDVVRFGAFVLLQSWTGWHNRLLPLSLSLLLLPAGFFMVLLGGTAPLVFAGEMVFGLAAGQVYYAALYYAMVVKNASVDAGGGHEGLIGAGFGLGPAAGLLAAAIEPSFHSYTLAILVGVGPLILTCSLGAVWQGAKGVFSQKQP